MALAAALVAIVAIVTCGEAAPLAAGLPSGRQSNDAALASAERRPHSVPASGEQRTWSVQQRRRTHRRPDTAASARARLADTAANPTQPATSRQGTLADADPTAGQSAQREGAAVRAHPERRALLERAKHLQSPVERRNPAHSHGPAAHRRPAQPSRHRQSATIARRRRGALRRAHVVQRLRQRLRQRRSPPPPPPSVQRKAARSHGQRPTASPHHSRKQPRSGRTLGRKPVRRQTRRPAEAVVSLDGDGGAASGAAKAHVTTAPLVVQQQQPPWPATEVRCSCRSIACGWLAGCHLRPLQCTMVP